ncbi:MAG: type II toxin-antitoxin system PemK/MazF family toxin [Treponema sp.]|nr:type II toxin-antitoxin system PemK/MazF family toxin [Treponema sp.]
MIRGEIWWANLPIAIGSTPSKRRPVLIIQSDKFNRSNINTIICAAITSNTEIASLPGNLLLEKTVSGLDKTSTVNFSQITAVDKDDLTEQVSMLPKSMLEKVNDCLRTVLEIP